MVESWNAMQKTIRIGICARKKDFFRINFSVFNALKLNPTSQNISIPLAKAAGAFGKGIQPLLL